MAVKLNVFRVSTICYFSPNYDISKNRNRKRERLETVVIRLSVFRKFVRLWKIRSEIAKLAPFFAFANAKICVHR